jgi:hypothetical protein
MKTQCSTCLFFFEPKRKWSKGPGGVCELRDERINVDDTCKKWRNHHGYNQQELIALGATNEKAN